MDLQQIQSGAGYTLPFNSPGTLISSLLGYIFAIAGIILVFMIISSGYQMMLSKGDPKVFQAAQGKLTTSIIGIVIIFVSFWIVKIILQFFGIDFLVPIIN